MRAVVSPDIPVAVAWISGLRLGAEPPRMRGA